MSNTVRLLYLNIYDYIFKDRHAEVILLAKNNNW